MHWHTSHTHKDTILSNQDENNCWLSHTGVKRVVFVPWAHSIIFSFSVSWDQKKKERKGEVSVGSQIYLWTRQPSPVHWLMTSPSLSWFLSRKTHNNTENESLSLCQLSYFLFQSICFPFCAPSSLWNPKHTTTASSEFQSLCPLRFQKHFSSRDQHSKIVEQCLICVYPYSSTLSYPLSLSLFKDAVQTVLQKATWADRGGWEREGAAERGSGRRWRVKTTGNKSLQINFFHRRCSQERLESMERTKGLWIV